MSYLAERDDYRRKRGALPKWVDNSIMMHFASVYDFPKASLASVSTKVRIVYDKGYHGGNRAKNDKLSTIDRLKQSLHNDMRTEGSMSLGEALPSDSTIAAFCRRRGIANRSPTSTDVTEDTPSIPSPPSSPLLGTSIRALLLATDIAGIPSFPDMEGVRLASYNRSPPVSHVIDMSAYDLLLPVSSMPSMPPVVSTGDIADSQPAPFRGSRPALPDCICSPDFDKRVQNS